MAGVLGARNPDTSINAVRGITPWAVILATYGARQIYSRTTQPETAIGDGVTLAWESGAVVADLEFVQFQPMALVPTATGRAVADRRS